MIVVDRPCDFKSVSENSCAAKASDSVDTKRIVDTTSIASRDIHYNQNDLTANPIILGESPTTGLPNAMKNGYRPLLIMISNPEKRIINENGEKVSVAGIGDFAPWGGTFADIVYEGVLYRTGQTRLVFLLLDCFSDNTKVSVGPVRSARIEHVMLREEWNAGLVHVGGPRVEGNNIFETLSELQAEQYSYNLLDNVYLDFKERISVVKAPNNYSIDAVGVHNLMEDIPLEDVHPFQFFDTNPYCNDDYLAANEIRLNWGRSSFNSSFVFDSEEKVYDRFSGDKPYMTYLSAEDRSLEHMQQMRFSNVIIQRVRYQYANEDSHMPIMESIGEGDADIFTGGRYIPGCWVRKDVNEPTVFFDNLGREIFLQRGKTFIAHFPVAAELDFN